MTGSHRLSSSRPRLSHLWCLLLLLSLSFSLWSPLFDVLSVPHVSFVRGAPRVFSPFVRMRAPVFPGHTCEPPTRCSDSGIGDCELVVNNCLGEGRFGTKAHRTTYLEEKRICKDRLVEGRCRRRGNNTTAAMLMVGWLATARWVTWCELCARRRIAQGSAASAAGKAGMRARGGYLALRWHTTPLAARAGRAPSSLTHALPMRCAFGPCQR